MTKSLFALLAISALCFGQTTPPPVNVTFQGLSTIPTSVTMFGSYNQLGTPKFTGGFGAFYSLVSKIKLYGATITTWSPKFTTNPTTGQHFYALSASAEQEFHADLIDTGNFHFLIGDGVGPTISQSASSLTTGTSSYTVSLSDSVIVTGMYQFSPLVGIFVRMPAQYISGAGWNIMPSVGISITLGKLPPAKQ